METNEHEQDKQEMGAGAPKRRRGASTREKHGRLTPKQVRVLKAMKDGRRRTANQITKASGVVRGRGLPQLVQDGYLRTQEPEEGQRGKVYEATAKGKKLAEKV